MASPLTAEWETLSAAGTAKRDAIKAQLAADAALSEHTRRMGEVIRATAWEARTSGSPLGSNLVTDVDRAAAEQKVMEIEQAKARAEQQAARSNARATLASVLMSDPGAEEVKALRDQRRVLEDQERKLKALLELEKIKLARKDDYFAARNALRQRREDKLKERRGALAQLQAARKQQEEAVMKIGAGLAPPPTEIIFGLRTMYAEAAAAAALAAGAGINASAVSAYPLDGGLMMAAAAGGGAGGGGGASAPASPAARRPVVQFGTLAETKESPAPRSGVDLSDLH
jgi:hypothetical protein